MKSLHAAALAALLLIGAPSLAFAHHGIVHEGCPTGQSFTAGGITVSGAYTRAMLPGALVAGGYFTIDNAGPDADTLTGASSEAANDIQIHQMKMNGAVMEMSPVEGGLQIPVGGSVALNSENYHLMLTGMETSFKQGACVQLTLHFEKAGDLAVLLNVGGVAQDEPPADGHNSTDMPPMDMSGMDMSGME